MRLKLCLPLVLLVVLLTGSVIHAGPRVPEKASDPDVGRYQLFEGTYTSIDLKRQQTSTHTGIFLIDTKTGDVKRYINKIGEDGKYVETWLPTELQTEK